jgi:hypothetical protein
LEEVVEVYLDRAIQKLGFKCYVDEVIKLAILYNAAAM